ncbi:MAG: aminotransferase class I/II-fold pyridoxal phosphate-dependent enzyme [Oscillospiraceae bacterium]
MTYNFDEIIDRRHTNALNTDGFRGYIFHAGPEKVFAFKDEEFVRMWVADMEFAVAPEILDALRARIDRRIFGYTGLYDDEYYRTFSKWCRDHYDWSFPKEQLCVSPGIIPALYQLTETLCGPDEKVLLNTPAYGYFLHAAEYASVDVLTSRCTRRLTAHSRWIMRTSSASAPIPRAS